MKPFHPKHQTHYESFLKFLGLIFIFTLYSLYLVYHHDLSKGIITAALTWSFFVLCTPVADAGFLLDFPLRLLLGWRMFTIEIYVWILALMIAIGVLLINPAHYETTFLTHIFKFILVHPYPYWSIILLCCIGTFASIYFGDEMMDVISHHHRTEHHKHGYKYKMIALLSIVSLVLVIYHILLKDFGIQLDLF